MKENFIGKRSVENALEEIKKAIENCADLREAYNLVEFLLTHIGGFVIV